VTEISVTLGDITTVRCDAIVNAANSALAGGGGVDGAIHRTGGPSIMRECNEIVVRQGGCAPGDAVVTTAGELPATWVIHTVGPIWDGTKPEEHDATLASAYASSLERAADHCARSVAFPNISTGVYGFPKDRAARVAVSTVARWVSEHPEALDSVLYVCFDHDNLSLYEALDIPRG